ncbi:UNKNOWN [Stylonychia lemnae]|uniref:Uncharacterized protein n=1 Tax=Stylonychia lemnae TaxID=5949 RepID=A0A077ZU87_STYLE|nr:UNKNOWN [Stylonychia lemnae]|eukprot:CDW73437.1 UNKNOWN [Stylonychia lemnae]
MERNFFQRSNFEREFESQESDEDEDDFMSDKYLVTAQQLDQNIRKDKIKAQKFDTKIKNADKLKDDKRLDICQENVEITRHNMKHQMMIKVHEGLETKITSENKGYQMLLKLGFKQLTSNQTIKLGKVKGLERKRRE